MSSQDGSVRLLDPSAMAKYGTSAGSDTSFDADRTPYEGSNGLDSSQLYRRPQEQPSFWNSVFSAYVSAISLVA